MSTQDFSNLYRELVTTRTFMASELLSYLMETPFQRVATEGHDKITPTSVVLQASTAFRERLESCPTQTVKKCTPIQFRDAFVKMVLGNDERHLADFLHCDSWDDAAQAMMDLEGTGQGVTFMKKVQKKATKPQEELDKEKSEKSRGERDRDSKKPDQVDCGRRPTKSCQRQLKLTILKCVGTLTLTETRSSDSSLCVMRAPERCFLSAWKKAIHCAMYQKV